MVDEEVDDIFKDFKFEDNEEPSHNEIKKKMQKEFNKQKVEEPEEKEFREDVKETKEKPEVKHFKSEPETKYVSKPGPGALERGVLIGIIVLLIAFIVVDLSFYHKGGVVEIAEEGKVTGMIVDEVLNESEKNETVEEVKEEVKEENETTETVEEKELSGTIDLKINKIYSRKVSSDLGYITKVSFIIKNGKDEILKPVVRVYAYDKSYGDEYMDKDRGIFNYTVGIMPSDEQAGSIDLTPKTFTALNTIKTVILQLSDEDGEVITSVMERFYIE